MAQTRHLVLGLMPRGADPDTHWAAGPWCFDTEEDFFPGWEDSFVFGREPLRDPGTLDRAVLMAQSLTVDSIPALGRHLLDLQRRRAEENNPVSTLLGETVAEPEADALKALSEKLEVLNLQFARQRERRRKLLHGLCIALCAGVVLAFGVLFTVGSPYMAWNYQDPETAVMGTALHAMEWLFVRAAPVLLIGAAAGAFLTRRRT